MNIAELKGDKSVKALATRLLATPAKGTVKTTQAEMEANLIRLNPQLAQIGELPPGTPVLVPEDFGLSTDESAPPLRGLAEGLLAQSEALLDNLRAVLDEQAAEDRAQSERVQAWIGSSEAKEMLKRSPDLKEVFASATAAAKAAPQEQAATRAAQAKALEQMQTALADFRARAAASSNR